MTLTHTLRQPDDLHCHFRDGEALKRTVPDAALYFARAVAMPNTCPPVDSMPSLEAYRARLLDAAPDGHFQPLMTLYLGQGISKATLQAFAAAPYALGIKYYPKNATTHAEAGVHSMEDVYPQLEQMEALGIPLMLHGESTRTDIDVFEREKVFIDDTLTPLLKRFPKLRMCLEHISTAHAVQFVRAHHPQVAATITAHHLFFNRNALFEGGLRPHFYCLPLLKTHDDQAALIEAATSGHPAFFLGTDSAPHARTQKESACGCAGIYSMPAVMPMLLTLFEAADALAALEGFTSLYGANFYGLPLNGKTVHYRKQPTHLPESLAFGSERLKPLFAGESLPWCLIDEESHDAE